MRWNTSHHRSADRACRLRAALAYSGTDSFTYAAGNSRGGSATATVTLTVRRTTRPTPTPTADPAPSAGPGPAAAAPAVGPHGGPPLTSNTQTDK
ncbi:Ig-like domain-containing protein [Streptomyces sp. NPDC056361]|uniref:Ig-like domain-containing protein n=1 Tax=Streptomyces sp. NPDC056361 TaxID=3345795 RepID=UPI0035DD5788